jgi:hypothetical protein
VADPAVSFRRRRAVQALASLLPLVGLVAVLTNAVPLVPPDHPDRGRLLLIGFFGALVLSAVVRIAVWRCPSCGALLGQMAMFTRRCGACDADFRRHR